MTTRTRVGHKSRAIFPAVFARVSLLSAFLLFARTPLAQAAQDPTPAPPLLHAYVNLLQVPVLVLGSKRQAIPLIDAGHFRVSIDSGPLFKPRYVRRQGDDPISLFVLVAANGAVEEHLTQVSLAMTRMTQRLSGRDQIAFSILRHCTLARSASVPANDPRLGATVVSMLSAKPTASANEPCAGEALWDALSRTVGRMSTQAGRRVVLVFTDGCDSASKMAWMDVQDLSARENVTIMAVRPSAATRPFDPKQPVRECVSPAKQKELDELAAVSELTGGMVLDVSPENEAEAFVDILERVRNRYILEFARPVALSSGGHELNVSVPGKTLFIRPASVSMPIRNVADAATSSTLPSTDPGPPIGARRVLKPQR